MRSLRVAWLGPCVLPLAVGGCPLTDDYFIQDAPVVGGASGGLAGAAGLSSGGSREGGSAPSEGGEAVTRGGAAGATCSSSTERCNGRDDDCDDVVDEQACNSMAGGTLGCSGFVLNGGSEHGYMLCTGVTREYARAQEACRAQGMRLAWLESAAENAAVSAKVSAIVAGLEAWIGARDEETEGTWGWDGQGGMLFWEGADDGDPVGDAYVAWAESSPNNSEQTSPEGEDCAVLLAASATWGDRACTIKYAYLCEEP